MELFFVYVFLCIVVGVLGRNTFIGFWGNFIFSLFLSPIIPLVYVLLSGAHRWQAQPSRSNDR